MKRRFTSRDGRMLSAFLADPAQPEGTLSYQQLRGFLYALATSPTLVPPSRWLPVVFGDDEPRFESDAQADRIMGSVFALYNRISSRAGSRDVKGVVGARLPRPPSMALDEDHPLREWSRGFVLGHTWLERHWDDAVRAEGPGGDEKLASLVMVLAFYASEGLARDLHAESAAADAPFEEFAALVARSFPDALADYAKWGRAHYAATQSAAPGPARAAPRAGRNDRCPCGSGRKFERCCGVGGW